MKTKSKLWLIIILLAIAAIFLVGSQLNRKSGSIVQCEGYTDVPKKKQCWAAAIEAAIGKNNISEALDLVAQVYEKNPSFSETCHGLIHQIGQKAYALFIQNKPFDLNGKTAYCSYGFYHGFMEALVGAKRDVSQARDFCAFVGRKLAAISPDAKYACYHGIGHGWADVHDARLFGNERAIAAPAVALCKKVAVEKEQLLRCATGVFDSISIAYYNKQNGLVMKKDDPLWLCREQEEGVAKDACYRDMMPAILWLGEYDLVKSAPYVVRFVENDYKDVAMQTLASDSMRYMMDRGESGFKAYLLLCRGLGQGLHIPCVRGLAGGIMEFGIPDKAHVLGLAICRRQDLTEKEHDACFADVLRYVVKRYPRQTSTAICKTIEEPYGRYCYEKK